MADPTRALAGISDDELEKLRTNTRSGTSLAAGAGPPSGENTVDLSSNSMMTGLGIARDVGLPMAGEAVGRLLPTSPVTGPIGAGVGEGAASLLRGDSFKKAGANAALATTFSAAMPFVGQRVMRAKRAPETVKSFFRGERSVGAATKKVLAEADRFGPDDAKVFLRSALSGRQAALQGKADSVLAQAIARSPGKVVPNDSLRASLEKAVAAPIEEFGVDGRKAARFALDLVQADDSQTLRGANKIRAAVWKAFPKTDPGDVKEIGKVVGLIDDAIEGATASDPRTLQLLKRSRNLRSLRRALFSDKGGGKPNLAKFFESGTDEEGRKLIAFVIDNSTTGDFRQLVRQAARAPNADEAMTSIRSLLLDSLDNRSPIQVVKEMRNAKSLLRGKLDAAFYPGFHKEIIKAADDAAKVQRFTQTFTQPVGSSRNTAGAGLGALLLPGNPLAAVAAGAAAPTLAQGAIRGAQALNTGVGRRAGAAAAGQGGRAALQRKLQQLQDAQQRGGVR